MIFPTNLDSEAQVSVHEAQASLVQRGIDPTKPGYRTAGYLIGSVAIAKGMDVTQEDFDHWVVTQGVLRSIDTLTDEIGLTDVTQQIEHVSLGRPVGSLVTRSEAMVYAGVLESYDDENRRGNQLAILAEWPKLEHKKRMAQNLPTYIRTIEDEADVYVALVKSRLKESETPQGLIRTEVNEWINNFIRGGYFVDYAHDMKKDYIKAQCRIPPTLFARLRLAGLAVTEGGLQAVLEAPSSSLPRIARLMVRYGLQ